MQNRASRGPDGMALENDRKRWDLAAYASVRAVAAIVSGMPLPVAMGLGRAVGLGVRLADPRHREVARKNLDAAYGESLTSREKERIIRDVYDHLGLIFVEMIKSPSFLGNGRWRERIRVEGEENAREAASKGKGILFVSGHVGNWEMLGVGMALLGYQLHSLYRPLDNLYLDRYVRKVRTRFGQKIVPQGGSLSTFVRLLREGKCLGMLVDQAQKSGGVLVDFFGQKASTLRTVAILHRRTGAPIVPGYIRRERGGLRHTIFIDRPIVWKRTPSLEDDVRGITQAFTSCLEGYVRDVPGQWLWLHRRWRTERPKRRVGALLEPARDLYKAGG